MARKPSLSSLTRQVRALERQRDEAHATIKVVRGERDAALKEANELARRYRERDDFASSNYKEAKEARDALEVVRRERDGLQSVLNSVNIERERERGYIEGLLDRQHPERPRLPWELQTGFAEVTHGPRFR